MTMTPKDQSGLMEKEWAGSGSALEKRKSPGEMNQDQELVLKLKIAIDQRGRYSYRLDDMASGYAAGKGISLSDAKRSIEDRFRREVGQTPQEYLDARYAARRREQKANTIGR